MPSRVCRPKRGRCSKSNSVHVAAVQMKTHEHAQGDPEAPLELLSFPRPEGAMMCGTPFGGKIEAMLRIAGVPYTGRVGNVLDKKQAPKRKVWRTL